MIDCPVGAPFLPIDGALEAWIVPVSHCALPSSRGLSTAFCWRETTLEAALF